MTALTRPGDRTHSACLSLSWLSRSVLPVRDPSPANSAARSSYVLCHREQCSHMFRAESLLTIRLRPFFNRISTPASPDVLGKRSVTYTSRKFLGVPCCSRLFQAKKYGRRKPCSRQNAFTLLSATCLLGHQPSPLCPCFASLHIIAMSRGLSQDGVRLALTVFRSGSNIPPRCPRDGRINVHK